MVARLSRLVLVCAVVSMGGCLALRPSVPPPRPERRVLLFYDMEGASGVDREEQFDSRSGAFADGREHLTGDVNAVIAGLFDGGATDVDVFNTHGAGGDTLVSRSRLDARARIVSRQSPRVAYDPDSHALSERYIAAVSIAAHDKPRSGGFAPHTVTVGTTPVLNGAGLTETDLLSYAVGTRGIPMIMASGDDVLGQSLARTLPWIEYVAVKRSTAGTVSLEPEARAQESLRVAAARALRRVDQGSMRPLQPRPPITAGLLPSYPARLYPTMDHLPGLIRHGDTVTFAARNYVEAYRGMMLLLTMAASAREGLVFDVLRAMPAGRTAAAAASDSIAARWAAFERGTWRPPPE